MSARLVKILLVFTETKVQYPVHTPPMVWALNHRNPVRILVLLF